MFPVNADLTPPSGTLSSAKNASEVKGEILMNVCVEGILHAVENVFNVDYVKSITKKTA
jgi:creatinine amidohydrolase